MAPHHKMLVLAKVSPTVPISPGSGRAFATVLSIELDGGVACKTKFINGENVEKADFASRIESGAKHCLTTSFGDYFTEVTPPECKAVSRGDIIGETSLWETYPHPQFQFPQLQFLLL
eukprot:GHVN01041287.1.p2 GENE.GHVN01041287.1~~GHVN01041287.1.p2  ORF type:complete len:118 (+),score=9.31 GHVN01041287.1:494-847(+)